MTLALDSVLDLFWQGTAASAVLVLIVALLAWVVWTYGYNGK